MASPPKDEDIEQAMEKGDALDPPSLADYGMPIDDFSLVVKLHPPNVELDSEYTDEEDDQ